MRTSVTLLLLCALFIGPVLADEKPAPPPKPLTPEQAADAVLDAVKAKDEKALKALAEKDDPDPWIVADELCYRGEHDVARAFAKAAPRKAVEKLPAYMASRREKEPDEEARKALTAMKEALGRKQWQQALDATANVSDPLDSVVRIQVAFGRGLALRGMRRRKDSAKALTETGRAAQGLGWLPIAAATFRQAGTSAYDDSDWRGVFSAWESQLQIERELGDKAGTAKTLGNIGSVQRRLGNYREALKYYDEALKISREFGNKAGIARALGSIGVVQKSLGNYSEALKYYDEALRISREFGDKAGIARALGNIGIVQMSLGNYPEALKYYDEGLRISREFGNKAAISRTLGNIGNVQKLLGNYEEALEHYAEVLKISRERGNRVGIAGALNNIGIVQESLGNYPEALKHYDEALQIKRELGAKAGIAKTLGNVGNVQKLLGNYEEALKHYDESSKIIRELGDKAGMAKTLGNIGNVQRLLGNYEEALKHYDESLKISRELSDKAGMAKTLGNIGNVQSRLGNSPDALGYYDESLKIARELGDKAAIASALNNIGGLQMSVGNYPEALKAYERARALLERVPHRDAQVGVSWGLARLHLRQKQPAKAAEFARQGVGYVSELSEALAEGEGAGAREVFSGLFDTGYRAALRAGLVEDLIWFLEQGRAGSLREGLGSRAALEAAVIPAELRKALTLARHAERRALQAYRKTREGRNFNAINSARKAWEEAQAEVGRVVARIQREAKAAAAVTLAAPDDLDAIQNRLGAGEALVLLGLTSEEAVALVVRKDGARMVALPASKEIEAAAHTLLDDERYVNPDEVPTVRKLLVDPLMLRKDVKRVLISPTGRLGYVPFALLFPLKEVAYVPSCTTHGLLLQERAQRGQKILALGDPDYQTITEATSAVQRGAALHKLVPLPATRGEVEAVGTTKLLGAAASESGLQGTIDKQKRWRAVHFACHGLVDPERPMLSALALTADEENDGFLTALEIFRMRIPADLVVMSACETGKGKIYKTEGIVGLTRAFMFAGAPRVICSLWKVDDEATQALMIKFYELWNPKDGSKGLGAAAALKKAQEFVRNHPDHPKWKHPYYWAAWVLWGLPD